MAPALRQAVVEHALIDHGVGEPDAGADDDGEDDQQDDVGDPAVALGFDLFVRLRRLRLVHMFDRSFAIVGSRKSSTQPTEDRRFA